MAPSGRWPAMARASGLSSSVKFLSGVDYEALPEADVFLLPSENETSVSPRSPQWP